jgi:hypothetical protein
MLDPTRIDPPTLVVIGVVAVVVWFVLDLLATNRNGRQ